MGVSEGYIACRACSRACSRVHNNGRKGSSVLLPCFFKAVSDHAANMSWQYSCRMHLPEAFRKAYLPNVKSQSMILEGPGGCEWPVIYRGGGFYSGWKNFSMDHGLMPGDLLYFTLTEDFRFMVQVFDKSGCEAASSFLVTNTGNYHDNWSRRKQEVKKKKRVTELVSAARGLTSKRANNAGSSRAGQEDAPSSSKNFRGNEGNLTSYMPASKQSKFEHAKYAFPTKNHRSFENQFSNVRAVVASDGEQKLGVDRLEEMSLRSLERSHKRKSDNVELELRKKRSKSMPGGNTPTTKVKYWGSEKTYRSGFNHTWSLKDYLRQSQVPEWRQTQAQIRARAVIERAKSMKVRLNGVNKNRKLASTPQIPAPTDTEENNSDDHEGSSDGAANSSLDGRSTSSGDPSFPDVERETSKEPGYGNSSGSEERGEIEIAGLTRLPHPGGRSSRFVHRKELAALRTQQKGFKEKLRRPQKKRGQSVSHPTESHLTITRTTRVPVLKSWKKDKDNVVLRRKPGRPRKHPINDDSVKHPEAIPSPYLRNDLNSLGGENPLTDRPRRRRPGRPFKSAAVVRTDPLEPKWRDVFISRRRPVNDSERDNALAAAKEFSAGMKETNIVVVMRPSFVYRNFVVGITTKAAALMPQQIMDVRVCNSDWKAWTCAWNPKYHYFCGRGWRNFALEHCLEADDACVFQVIECRKTVLILKVHIFRVVAIPVGQTAWQAHICPADSFPDADRGLTIERKDRSSPPVSLISHGHRKDEQAERSTKPEQDIESSTLEQKAKILDAVHRKSRDSPSIAISSDSLQAPRKKSKQGVKADFQKSEDFDGTNRNYYKVVRLHDRKRIHNKAMFLVELAGPVLKDMMDPICERNAHGFWWVPQNNFTPDFLRCYIE